MTAYDVGYGKPPKKAQFKPGQSGNPKGRPKGSLNLATVLERTLRETVVVRENGRRKTINKLQAAFKQITKKAASGNLKAFQIVTSLKSTADRASNGTVPNPLPDEAEERVFLGILKRLEAASQEDPENEDSTIPE